MRKFIYSDGEIDLSGKQLTDNEENHWFSERFFTKYSFPVELEITDELNLALGNVQDHNASDVNAYIEGYYLRMGEEHRAVLVLDRLSQVCSFTIRYGFEELPNWNKKLAELPLQQLDLGTTTIRDHATSILDTDYPASNYNFPQIHINSLDTEIEQWQYFENRLNARVAGAFLNNEYDGQNDEQINRTIMQPLPHLFHVIKAGFNDAGYDVSGDFFSDNAFAKAFIFHFSEYYRSFNNESQELIANRSEHNGTFIQPGGNNAPLLYNYDIQSTALNPGRYLVTGSVRIVELNAYFELKIGNTVYARNRNNPVHNERNSNTFIDFTFDILPSGPNTLQCVSSQSNFYNYDGITYYDDIWLDLSIAQIARYDSTGNLVSTLIDATRIDLRKCVPDITFGDLLTSLKQTIGLDIIPKDNAFELGLIKNQIRSNEVIDLSGYEVRFPQRDFKEGDIYSLSFKEQNSENYENQIVKIDRNSAQTITSSIEENDINEVEINLVPLPLSLNSGVLTASQVSDDKDTLYICKYNGLQNGNNWCIDTSLNLLELYDNYLDDLYKHLINGQPYQWSFIAPEYLIKKIKTRSRIFAYNKIFIVSKIQATDLGHDSVQVQLDLIAVL